MIDRRELLEKSRQRGINLQLIEKDYVLGWLLFAISQLDDLVFKGGTALAKLYFPRTWRLSEDLDFAFLGDDFNEIAEKIEKALVEISIQSGIGFSIKSRFSNPDYLQLKIRYDAVLGRNWAKIDATRERPDDRTKKIPIAKTYSDYPDFKIRTESLEEIFAEKLRALLERKKSRDFYDVWLLFQTDFDAKKLKSLFKKKCSTKGIDPQGIATLMPDEAATILAPYWERELGRLVNPLSPLDNVLKELNRKLISIVR